MTKISPSKKSAFDPITASGYMFTLGNLAMRFASVERAPRYPSGERENDAEHSFHLALTASELATNYYPDLDSGLVTQFSLVHDLPESYAGDTWTIKINDKDRATKELVEKEATERLLKELPPHTRDLLKRYEKQLEPEARFVRFVDKLLPEVINMVTGNASTFKDDHDINNREEMNKVQQTLDTRYRKMFPEFPVIQEIRDKIIEIFTNRIFPDGK